MAIAWFTATARIANAEPSVAPVEEVSLPSDPPPIAEPMPMPTPLDGLGANLADAFGGQNLFYYAGAVATSAAMVTSGTDQAIRIEVQQRWSIPSYGQAAVVTGYVLPTVVAPAIYLVGLFTEDRTLAAAGAAAVQALAVTVAATSMLKWATGRPYPMHGGDPNDPHRLAHPEYAREFRPFNFDGAWAWPSGHTSASISIAAALTAFYPEEPWIPSVA
ncbi:MAG TPA: hypothetical protein VGL13_06390, partial [Polyangiaceae bacterium]